jgi:hypothetical protein
MRKIGKRIAIFILIAALVNPLFVSETLAQGQSNNDKPTAGAKVADLVFVRPVAVIGTVLGFIIYSVSLPFTYLGGNSEEAYQKLAVEPAKFAFKRPLGEF